MRKVSKSTIYLILFFLPTAHAAGIALSIPISTSNIKGSCAATILTKAYSELDYQLIFHEIPAQRALVEANKGHFDGVMNRIEGLDNYYPNLVRILTPICINTYSLYMLSGSTLKSPLELNTKALGIKKGNTPLENIFKRISPFKATSYQQLINMLITKRLDVIAMNEAAFANAIRSMKRTESINNIISVDYPFPIDYGYHYLHKKHIDLIPLINKKLANFESNGYIKRANEKHRNYILYEH